MRTGGWLHRRLAWLALCAVVFGAFAPTISKTLAAAQPSAWVEVCTTSGIQRISVDQDVPQDASKKQPNLPAAADGHCGYCLLQAHCPAVPSTPHAVTVVAAASDRLPVGSGGTTLPKRFARSAHHPRAPPAFS